MMVHTVSTEMLGVKELHNSVDVLLAATRSGKVHASHPFLGDIHMILSDRVYRCQHHRDKAVLGLRDLLNMKGLNYIFYPQILVF